MANPAQVVHFHRHGYAILPGVLNSAEIGFLKDDCDQLFNHCSLEKDIVTDMGCIIEPFSSGLVDIEPHDWELLKENSDIFRRIRADMGSECVPDILLDKMAKLAADFLPISSEIYLLNEQYIIKPPYKGPGTQFAWHKDSEYLPSELWSEPTVSCWVALDDVHKDNGTLILDPYPTSTDHSGTSLSLDEYIEHHTRADSSYPPSQVGSSLLTEPTRKPIVSIPAGSVVIMSGWVRHCSLANRSSHLRRCWMPQYASRRLTHKRPPNEKGVTKFLRTSDTEEPLGGRGSTKPTLFEESFHLN
ncbi:hypothetical protein BJ085DRAFT_37210 [Dimargaris cristalligena]|uniref:Phytanoyl-CoA dioxygenase family protein n=1 Tax=Dimargaris cristalligena TaxID=215637 RepID=A0A4P9ZTK3_9FUNG|nr:hypothetical protein BJ085DRAFT_37210 [Dimargaris cristalligena]|eukprot:RKP36171.1 hypothetical protein BJ085DRAFT_37210 [Dimargaris cristalligena]